jgi:hypothetical protein
MGTIAAIDYAEHDFTTSTASCDVVFDAHDRLGFAAVSRVLPDHVLYVTTLAMPPVLLHAAWRRIVGKVVIRMG